jgi:hypothetical protein
VSHPNRLITAILCALALAAVCIAQTDTSFSVLQANDNTSNAGFWTPRNMYAVDVNNDGIPDLIQNTASAGATVGTGQFGVSIANGDGTFKPAVAYNYPPGILGGAPMAFGDFRGDGVLDIAMTAGDC